jgi:hypothetical protein
LATTFTADTAAVASSLICPNRPVAKADGFATLCR